MAKWIKCKRFSGVTCYDRADAHKKKMLNFLHHIFLMKVLTKNRSIVFEWRNVEANDERMHGSTTHTYR